MGVTRDWAIQYDRGVEKSYTQDPIILYESVDSMVVVQPKMLGSEITRSSLGSAGNFDFMPICGPNQEKGPTLQREG